MYATSVNKITKLSVLILAFQ